MRNPEFQALWLGHAVSMAGGNLLTIAVAVLVYERTGSAWATGFTLALTFLSQIVAGPLLSGLADLLPRRRVLIASDVMRAVLVVSLALPSLPIWGVWGLVFATSMLAVPFGAARAALLTQIVLGDRYVAGSAIINLTSQVGTLLGLVAGGAAVAALGPHQALLCNSLTFVVSAAVVAVGVEHRPAVAGPERRPGLWRLMRQGTRLVFADPRLRTLVLLAWLAGCYVVPLGIAAPLAAGLGAGTTGVSLIMAAVPAGALLGGFVLTRLVAPRSRTRMLGPLAVLASLPLIGVALHPPLWVLVALLVISGGCGSYQFVANAAFVLCVPAEDRGLAFGLAAAGLQAAQGIGILLASLAVNAVGAPVTVAAAGVAGVAGALALLPSWQAVRGRVGARVDTGEAPVPQPVG